jgi:hypothetical protein
MSTYGSLFRVTTYGESHCPSVGAIVDGCPPVRLGSPSNRIILTSYPVGPAIERIRHPVATQSTEAWPKQPHNPCSLSPVFFPALYMTLTRL